MIKFYLISSILITVYTVFRIRFPLPHRIMNKNILHYWLSFYNPFGGRYIKVWELVLNSNARRIAKIFLEGLKGTGRGVVFQSNAPLEPPYRSFTHDGSFSRNDIAFEPNAVAFGFRFIGFFIILSLIGILGYSLIHHQMDIVLRLIPIIILFLLIPLDRSFRPCVPNNKPHPKNTDHAFLQIHPSKHDELSFDKAYMMLSSLSNLSSHLSMEIIADSKQITIQAVCDSDDEEYIENTIYAAYPNAEVVRGKDLIKEIIRSPKNPIIMKEYILTRPYFYPLQVFKDFRTDPLSNLMETFSNVPEDHVCLYQVLFAPARNDWQKNLSLALVNPGDKQGSKAGRPVFYDDPTLTKLSSEKRAQSICCASIRTAIFSNSSVSINDSLIHGMDSYFHKFQRPGGNRLSGTPDRTLYSEEQIRWMIQERSVFRHGMLLSDNELASLCHLPNLSIHHHKVQQAGTVQRPQLDNNSDSGVKLGYSRYRGKKDVVILDDALRDRHVYMVAKTRMGKTTLIENMSRQDIANGHGVCSIDPHGDSIQDRILPLIPRDRIQDVIYFNPCDRSHPMAFNMLDNSDNTPHDLLCSDIINALERLFTNSWGPRLESILRYTISTLLEAGDCTLIDVLRIYSDKPFREEVLSRVETPDLLRFWQSEFPSLAKSALGPVQNKLSRFVLSPVLRNMFGQKENRIDFRRIMDEQKILLINLSQGELGEDVSRLLGAFLVSKIQHAAMSRASLPVAERKSFCLYVDEFQNFISSSFEKILSEAGKYKLNLTLSHQFTSQLPDSLKQAILGNVGSLIAFRIGISDAKILARELLGFKDEDLVVLGRGQTVVKLGNTGQAFNMETLPPYNVPEVNYTKEIIQLSREKYTSKVKSDETTSTKELAQTYSLNEEDFYE